MINTLNSVLGTGEQVKDNTGIVGEFLEREKVETLKIE